MSGRKRARADAVEPAEEAPAASKGKKVSKKEQEAEGKGYWLIKSEPDEYSLDTLKSQPKSTGFWDGVRNFQAKNLILQMKVGDECFFYHSSCKVPAIVGIAEVVSEPRPDPTALDPKHKGYDAKSSEVKPRFFGMDVKYVRAMQRDISLTELKTHKEGALKDFTLLRVPRLSVHRVPKEDWDFILDLEKKEKEG